jgi:retron-type reverse transcriptase
LKYTYRCCKSNGGAPGPAGRSFEKIEEQGRKEWPENLAEELRDKTYIPEAVRRKWIPKANEKLRPLGIPAIMDRVVQISSMLILNSIFEV